MLGAYLCNVSQLFVAQKICVWAVAQSLIPGSYVLGCFSLYYIC